MRKGETQTALGSEEKEKLLCRLPPQRREPDLLAVEYTLLEGVESGRLEHPISLQ